MRNDRIGYRLLLVLLLQAAGLPSAVAQNDRPQMYLFTMEHCPPCRDMEPTVERLLREGYPIQKIDCQTQPQWANHFQITQTPTVVLVRTGQPVARHVGGLNYADLVGMFHAVGFSPTAAAAPPSSANSLVPSAATAAAQSELVAVPAPAPLPGDSTVPRSTEATTGSPHQLARAATVRLKVEDPTGISYGTGTVIHRYQNAYLVLTCGHIFRESRGQGVITVDHGFATATPTSVRGSLLSYDAEARDVGLVIFESPMEIPPARLAPQVFPVQANDAVFTLGCNHGADPTLVTCQILRAAIYDGAKKYDTTVRPVDGRSGGGLFSAGGQLIGICNAAAVEQEEGIYSSLENIFVQLQQANLGHLFGEPQAVAATPPPAVTIPVAASEARSASTAGTVSAVEPTSLPADLEMIVIVRSKSDPEQMRTYTISNPPSTELARLEAMTRQPASDRLAAEKSQTRLAENVGSPPVVIRGQSNR